MSLNKLIQRNVVIYARVSTEHEAQLSALENQKDWYKPFVEAHPEWKIIKMYVDEGITGTSAQKRPQFMKMIEDAKRGDFDLILTREVSRFARNTVDTLQYTRTLKSLGVEVFFINDNIKTFDGDGELRLTIMATLAQDESRKTSVRVKSGQQTSMQNGTLYGNGNILGYDRVVSYENGKKKVEFIQNDEQAKTVRMIYDWYLDGHGMRQIQFMLEGACRLTSEGKRNWHMSNISKILKNSFYCGVITYHKQYTPDFLEQKKINNHGEVELIQVRGTHQPIVTEREFDMVQKILSSRTIQKENSDGTKSTMGVKASQSVWTRLLECECGHKFIKRLWHKNKDKTTYGYQCCHSARTGTVETRKRKGLSLEGVCRSPMIPEWKLQIMAKYIFENHINNLGRIVAIAESMLEKFIDENPNESNDEKISKREKQREKLTNRLNNLTQMRADGEIDRDTFVNMRADTERQIQKINEEIEILKPQTPEDEKSREEKLTILKYYLEQSTSTNKDNDIPDNVIEAFVRKIVVHENGFDWYLRFDHNGEPSDNCKVGNLNVEGRKNSANTGVSNSCVCSLQPRLQLAKIGNNIDILKRIEKSPFTHFYDDVVTLDKVILIFPISRQQKGYWTDLNISVYL